MTLHLGNVRKAALAAALLLGPAAASAANPVGNAAAHDFSIHINLIGLTSLDVTSQTSASLLDVVTDASDLDQLPSLSLSDPLNLISLSSGELIAEAEYAAGPMSAIAARSTVNDLDLSVATVLVDVLGLSSGVIRSTTAMSGYCPATPGASKSLLGEFVFGTGFDFGNLNGGGGNGGGDGGGGPGGLPPGGTDLIDPVITILGIPVPALPTNPPPNTSIDLNATDHPLGARDTFSDDQVAAIRAILAEVSPAVAWGGDFAGRRDEMHFEIVGSPEVVAEVAARLRGEAPAG